jgi:hypothetical protein
VQKCKKCGAEIKYIATTSQQSIACNAEKLRFVTDNGRILEGYLIHKCETENKENGSR